MTESNKKNIAVEDAAGELVKSAPPPLASVVLMGFCVSLFLHNLPSASDIDAVATTEAFTSRLFPSYISLTGLIALRSAIAASIWYTSFHSVFLSEGWTQITSYMEGSKLRKAPNRLVGIKTMLPFTSMSWNLLGLSYTFNAYIAYLCHSQQQQEQSSENEIAAVSPWLLRSAMLLWEVSAPCTILVAFVIRYAIWPKILATPGGDTTQLKTWRNVMMHNMNVFFALFEVAILGGLPVVASHMCVTPLYGCCYVLFSWYMSNKWNDVDKYGVQYIYFFFDTTLPGYTSTIALVVLLVFLLCFYGLFCSAEEVLHMLHPKTANGDDNDSDGGAKHNWLSLHLAFVIFGSSLVMRFRD